jgi:hypothetical protein
MKRQLAAIVKRYVSPQAYEALRGLYRVNLALLRPAQSRFVAGNLTALARIHGSDKWGRHWYTPHYASHFGPIRRQRLKVLEIGVGGYADANAGGESLRMWKYYFPKSDIYSIDLYDKSRFEEHRIKIFRGSQDDPQFLRSVVEQMGGLDIVIDDGSHINDHVLTSFNTLFPLMSQQGIYVIEDTQTSYWPEYGGDSYDLKNQNTVMTFLKGLTDGVNYEEIARNNYEPSYFDRNIVSLHFYHNLVFIYKGVNREGSNLVHEHIY